MNKYAAEKIAQEYYNLGIKLAFQKLASIDLSEIQDAMEAQEELYRGSIEDRIGSAIEQRRREGAVAGTLSGGGLGALLGAAAGAGANKNKALMALGALLGGSTGAVGGNLLGRVGGVATGALEGGSYALPGVRQTADFLSRPLDEY
jgi:hypothetical protein